MDAVPVLLPMVSFTVTGLPIPLKLAFSAAAAKARFGALVRRCRQ